MIVKKKVAIIGGGCGALSAAYELSEPGTRFDITVYQVGWRLGGKGASGRGPAGRIEEHGLHLWLGFYENSFGLMRRCYSELNRNPADCPICDWRQAFEPHPHVGVADIGNDTNWIHWTANFPPMPGSPGDPLDSNNPFTAQAYLQRTVGLLRTLILRVHTGSGEDSSGSQAASSKASSQDPMEQLLDLLRRGVLFSAVGILQALSLLEVAIQISSSCAGAGDNLRKVVEPLAASIRSYLEALVEREDDFRYLWEIIDCVLAIIVGAIRFRLLYDPAGLDAIDDYECREWLLLNGASERAVQSAFVRGLYDLALAYEDGDYNKPRLAAGQALRGAARMFFTYRGQLFWRMQAGMGDIVFAPLYEVLKNRGVKFKFFHRLTNLGLSPKNSDDTPHVCKVTFDQQAETVGNDEYQPLVNVNGLPCWPAEPDFSQLKDGNSLRTDAVDFESHWEELSVRQVNLTVGKDFDFVVLGVGLGEVPHVCGELIERDSKWRAMVKHMKTVATQAFQIWLREDMNQLGWDKEATTISAFVKPFDTWADMTHVLPSEDWADSSTPRSLAYFCNVLQDFDKTNSKDYPAELRDYVKQNAIKFLQYDIAGLWPNSIDSEGEFRWGLLVDPSQATSENSPLAFMSQYWRANVNPTDRYVLALPGTQKFRISPLDNTYDNFTIAGDWTDCGFNEGCVEAAVMSGKLAAHALSGYPKLEDIIGYDHP